VAYVLSGLTAGETWFLSLCIGIIELVCCGQRSRQSGLQGATATHASTDERVQSKTVDKANSVTADLERLSLMHRFFFALLCACDLIR